MKKNVLLLCSVLVCFSACKKESAAPLNITENLPGVWKIISFVKDGTLNNPSGDFSNNYFMFYNNNYFSARTGSSDSEIYFYGNFNISEPKIILKYLSENWNDEDVEVNDISGTDFKFTVNDINGGITSKTVITLSKVNTPTTYRVHNATSSPLGIFSFYYDTAIRDFSNHGTVPARTYGIGQVYTLRDKIILGVTYMGNNFITVYPQVLLQGHENTLVMADTTTVFEGQSNIKSLSGESLKSLPFNQKLCLKEAIERCR